MFLRSNKLERLEFKLEKIIGIKKHAGKVRKLILHTMYNTQVTKKSNAKML